MSTISSAKNQGVGQNICLVKSIETSVIGQILVDLDIENKNL